MGGGGQPPPLPLFHWAVDWPKIAKCQIFRKRSNINQRPGDLNNFKRIAGIADPGFAVRGRMHNQGLIALKCGVKVMHRTVEQESVGGPGRPVTSEFPGGGHRGINAVSTYPPPDKTSSMPEALSASRPGKSSANVAVPLWFPRSGLSGFGFLVSRKPASPGRPAGLSGTSAPSAPPVGWTGAEVASRN